MVWVHQIFCIVQVICFKFRSQLIRVWSFCVLFVHTITNPHGCNWSVNESKQCSANMLVTVVGVISKLWTCVQMRLTHYFVQWRVCVSILPCYCSMRVLKCLLNMVVILKIWGVNQDLKKVKGHSIRIIKNILILDRIYKCLVDFLKLSINPRNTEIVMDLILNSVSSPTLFRIKSVTIFQNP